MELFAPGGGEAIVTSDDFVQKRQLGTHEKQVFVSLKPWEPQESKILISPRLLGVNTTLLHPVSFVLLGDDFYQIFPAARLHGVYGTPTRSIWEEKSTPLHSDLRFFTAWDLECVR